MEIEEEIRQYLRSKGILGIDKRELFIVQKDGSEIIFNDLIQEFHELKTNPKTTDIIAE